MTRDMAALAFIYLLVLAPCAILYGVGTEYWRANRQRIVPDFVRGAWSGALWGCVMALLYLFVVGLQHGVASPWLWLLVAIVIALGWFSARRLAARPRLPSKLMGSVITEPGPAPANSSNDWDQPSP